MASKAKNDTCVGNFDTSSAKAGANPENKSQNFVKNEIDFSQNECKSMENETSSNATSENEVNFAKNSIIKTTNSSNFAEVEENKIIDTSSNSPDPLSVINSEIAPNVVQKLSSNEEENLVFNKLFPGVSLEKINQDELFRLFSSHNGNKLTISDLYTNYLRFISMVEGDFAKKSLVSLQNKLLSPGSLASSEKSGEIFFTKEQVLKMSPSQIADNYEIIRKSQQKW
jgi:hypothetical protein